MNSMRNLVLYGKVVKRCIIVAVLTGAGFVALVAAAVCACIIIF